MEPAAIHVEMTTDQSRRILVVDDNQSIRDIISDYLESRGYAVLEASDGIQGLEMGLSSGADVIILDVVMPGLDGFKVCRLLRDRNIRTPIIVLTERNKIEDKVTGFSLGADDYLGKPFSPLELELRIQALLRRSQGETVQAHRGVLVRGDIEIDLDRHVVMVKGRDADLTPIEFNILKLLAATPGRVYSRHDLLSLIWDTDYEGYKRNIDPHVNRLRTKIESNPKKPEYVLTVWGVGYKFNEKTT